MSNDNEHGTEFNISRDYHQRGDNVGGNKNTIYNNSSKSNKSEIKVEGIKFLGCSIENISIIFVIIGVCSCFMFGRINNDIISITPTQPTNNIAHQGMASILVATNTIEAGSTIKMNVVVQGHDGKIISYFWSAEKGTVTNDNSAFTSYTAPNVSSALSDTIYVIIVTDKQEIIEEEINVSIQSSLNPLVTISIPPEPIIMTTITPAPTETSTLEPIIFTTITPPPSGEKVLAFASDRDGDWEIYTINVDNPGQTITRLTTNTSSDTNPDWSPDGSKIAFETSRDGNFEIYVMNADGSNQQRLTANPKRDLAPAWSPDGTKIAFQSELNGVFQIYIVEISTNNTYPLTLNEYQNYAPAWSPDGRQIVFFSNRGVEGTGLYRVNIDVPGQEEMVVDNGFDPDWSPDGRMIMYASTYHGDKDLAFLNFADGHRDPTIWRKSSTEMEPVWSSDGQWIAFTSDRAGQANRRDIYIIKTDETELQRITSSEGNSQQPTWRP